MRKLTIAIIMLFSSLSLASAEMGVKIGVSLDAGTFETTASENENGEVSASKSAKSLVGYGSFFIEKTLGFLPGPFGRLSVGYSNVPHDLKSGSASTHKNDITGLSGGDSNDDFKTGDTNAVDQKIQVDFSNFNTLYATLNITDWLYVKAGSMEVDVTTNEDLGTGSTYGNTSLDGNLIGAGIHIEKDNGLFFRFEVNDQSFDGVKLTSTNNSANSVTVTDLDGTTAKVAIGKSF